MSANIETNEDDRIVAKCYVELGNVTKEKGEYDESLRYHRKSLEIFERIDDALSVADSHLNIAEVYKAKGELKQAMSEYEKGLTLYEDVYVDEATKNSDSGTDVSLNSSSFSDLQHTRSLSKSERILPQATLLNTTETNISNSTLKMLNGEQRKSPTTSSISDLQYINANDMFLPLSSNTDFVYQTTGEATPDDSDILEIELPSSFDQNLEEIDKNYKNKSINKISELWQHLLNKQFLIIIIIIIILSIFLTGVVCWLSNGTSTQSLLSCSSFLYEKSYAHDSRDLNAQLRKMLIWQQDRLTSLNKDNRQIIEEFLKNSDSQIKTTLDEFQHILDMLDLKIVLIPQ